MNKRPSLLKKVIDSFNDSHKYNKKNDIEIDNAYKALTTYYGKHDTCNIDHALSVAQRVADWRLDCSAIVAAILHEIPAKQISNEFGAHIIYILDEIKGINVQLEEFYEQQNISKIDDDQKYLKSPFPEALYIIISDEIDMLSCKDASQDELLVRAKKIREVLVPQVEYIKAFRLVDTLLELCLKIENRTIYESIVNKIDEIKLYNGDYQTYIIKKMNQIFDRHSRIISKELEDKQAFVKSFLCASRSVHSIYRYINSRVTDWNNDSNCLVTKQNIALYDLTLIIDDKILMQKTLSAHDIFFDYYNEHLRKEKIYIIDYDRTTYQDAGYYILCDQMDNLYRIFVKTETDYLHYMFGGIIEKDKFTYNFEKEGKQIKVFKRDGSATLIESGSSVLDFAFKIHSNLGLHFDYALLNNSTQFQPAYKLLKPGDTVIIKTKPEITAEPQWIRYVKTDSAIYYLTRYFTKEFTRLKKEQLIEILTKDGTSAKIEYGATVLDLAFKIHGEMGLRFDYAVINDKRQHRQPYTVLNDGDTVVIQTANYITADLQWFRYLKTDYAKKQLVKYFTSKRSIMGI